MAHASPVRARITRGQVRTPAGRAPRYTNWLVMERGDPATADYDRAEVAIEVGVTAAGEAILGPVEVWSASCPGKMIPSTTDAEFRRCARLLARWLFTRRPLGLRLHRLP